MIYGTLAGFGIAGLFLFLYVRSAIANGKLRLENLELKRDVAILEAQVKIAAQPKKSPEELLKMMREKKL